MKNLIIVFLNLILTQIAFGQEVSLTPAESLLEADILKSGIFTLKRDLTLYHYFNAPMQGNNLWPTFQTPSLRGGPNGQTHFDLAIIAGAFWDPDFHLTKDNNGGPGMYLAVDPLVSSEAFGHSAYIMTFPEGTKYLDVSDPTWTGVSKIKLSSGTLPALEGEKIVNEKSLARVGLQKGYFSRITMQYMVAPGNERLREAITKIFVKNDITLVDFSWMNTKLKVFCKQASSSAFVYIGNKSQGLLEKRVAAQVPVDVIDRTIFMSPFPVQTYTPSETRKIQITQEFKNALAVGSRLNVSPEVQAEIKQMTFDCQ